MKCPICDFKKLSNFQMLQYGIDVGGIMEMLRDIISDGKEITAKDLGLLNKSIDKQWAVVENLRDIEREAIEARKDKP